MVPIVPIEGSNQEPCIGQSAQRPYTVSSMVSERSAGPSMTPRKPRRRSIWLVSAARPASTSRTISPLWVVPRLRAVVRSFSSRARGRVMFFLTWVATATGYTLQRYDYTPRSSRQAPARVCETASEFDPGIGTRDDKPRLIRIRWKQAI